MEPKNDLQDLKDSKVVKVYDNSRIEDTGKEVETFQFPTENGLCDQLIEKILAMSPEVRTQFDYSIATQGPGVKIPRSGGDIEVIPGKVMIKISPKSH